VDVNLTLWEKQNEFIHAPEKSVLLQCGIGYGKTFSGCLFITLSVFKYAGKNFMIVSRDIPQFKKAVLPELLSIFKMFSLVEGVHYKHDKSSQTFTFWNGVTIYCVGAVNYDSAFRGPNISIIMADEAEYYKPEAWRAMLGRLRVEPELLRITSTPNGFNFVSDYFDNNSPDKKILIAPTWENKSLSEEYVEMLRSTYSPRLFEQECAAKRLLINVGAVYNEFSRDVHVKPCRHLLSDQDQLYFFTDYNIANYCGTYMFYDRANDIGYSIGEEHLKFEGSRIMAKKIKAKYPTRPVIVIGDATGNNKRDVAITKTNYEHFRDAGLLTERFKNPPVESRIISANSNLYHRKHFIDPSCKTLIKDLELTAWSEDGKSIAKDNIDLSHASDSFSYGDWFFHGIIKKRKAKFTASYY